LSRAAYYFKLVGNQGDAAVSFNDSVCPHHRGGISADLKRAELSKKDILILCF
jgi:hypothetical protein